MGFFPHPLHRRVGQKTNFDVGSHKTRLKKVKSSIKLQNVFRRVSHGSNSSGSNNNSNNNKSVSTADGGGSGAGAAGNLFGVCLSLL